MQGSNIYSNMNANPRTIVTMLYLSFFPNIEQARQLAIATLWQK